MKWAVLFSVAAVTAFAQEPRFNARAHEVVVPVSVLSKGGKLIENLNANDFRVLSDGKPQTTRMISREGDALPVYAVIVLQTSGSSDAALAKIKKTASIVSSYITNEMETAAPSLAAVVTTSDDVKVDQNFTANANVLQQAFEKIVPSGDAGRLIDGVSLACDLLAAKKESARRVIVLIGESRDRSSKAHLLDVAAKAQKDDIVIYTLSYSAYETAFTQKASERQPTDEPGSYDPEAHGTLPLLGLALELGRLGKINTADALAQATGGAHDKFTTLRGLETHLITVGNEMHNRYTLTFVPPDPQPAGYHRLAVTVLKSGNYQVHARAGYWTGAEELK